jgi:tRNA 2-(methylsulfanyl)-N6-isopentenyladenosine37 hydroxylase
MKFSINLIYQTSPEWVDCVMQNFDKFLQDHADCERKASAMAMSFIAKCPDKTEIIPELIETAIEELEHFRSVYQIMEKRGLTLNHEIEQDVYIKQLIDACRSGRDERLLDRMLVASIVECRGAERFRLVEEALEDKELKQFYKMLWASEAKHGNIFVKLALNYWDKDIVYKRLDELNIIESTICKNLKIRPALH